MDMVCLCIFAHGELMDAENCVINCQVLESKFRIGKKTAIIKNGFRIGSMRLDDKSMIKHIINIMNLITKSRYLFLIQDSQKDLGTSTIEVVVR